jgi:hypothetical protein
MRKVMEDDLGERLGDVFDDFGEEAVGGRRRSARSTARG